MEGEIWKGEFSGSSKNVIPYSNKDALSPEVWHDMKMRVTALLDDSVPYSFKKSTAEQLCQLFERLEHKSTIGDDLAVASVQSSEMKICTVDHHYQADPGENQLSLSADTHELNDRLRSKIAEFNEGLAHLGNKILKLKTRLLSWSDRPTFESDSVDLDTCRHVNRNFRRILQKESRYLRDQLHSARETIQRFERRSLVSTSEPSAESRDSNLELVPYYELKCRPTDFINIESGTPQLWLMSPIKTLQAAAYSTPGAKLVQPRSALLKRSAPPLEVVAGPDVKSGKFVCSFNGPTSASSSSLVEWMPNQIGHLATKVRNDEHERQTEDNQHRMLLT